MWSALLLVLCDPTLGFLPNGSDRQLPARACTKLAALETVPTQLLPIQTQTDYYEPVAWMNGQLKGTGLQANYQQPIQEGGHPKFADRTKNPREQKEAMWEWIKRCETAAYVPPDPLPGPQLKSPFNFFGLLPHFEKLTGFDITHPAATQILVVQDLLETFQAQPQKSKEKMGTLQSDLHQDAKVLAKNGGLCQVRVVINSDSDYTGVLTKDTMQHGLLRMSPYGPDLERALRPPGQKMGVALKLFRKNVHSANLLNENFPVNDAFKETNLFKDRFTNHNPQPFDKPTSSEPAFFEFKLQTQIRVAEELFALRTQCPTRVGVSDLAMYEKNGNKVTQPRAPWRLELHGDKDAAKLTEPDLQEQGKSDTYKKFSSVEAWATAQFGKVMEVVNNRKAPMKLFDLLAVEDTNPAKENPVKIGEVLADECVHVSQFGDGHLHFFHQDYAWDVALRVKQEYEEAEDEEKNKTFRWQSRFHELNAQCFLRNVDWNYGAWSTWASQDHGQAMRTRQCERNSPLPWVQDMPCMGPSKECRDGKTPVACQDAAESSSKQAPKTSDL